MLIRTKEKVTVEKEIATGFECDHCGGTYYFKPGPNYLHDGGSFTWRMSEEDEILIDFGCICDNCYENQDMHIKLQELADKIKELFPHASVRSFMMEWGTTGEFVED